MQRHLFVWHRRIGLCIALFLIFLVVTGIALQHSDGLKLPSRFLSHVWLLEYYGIRPNPVISFEAGVQTVSYAGQTIYLSGDPVSVDADGLLGAVVLQGNIVIATPDSVIVCDSEGSVIDQITGWDGLNELPLGIALGERHTVVLRGLNAHWEGNVALTKWVRFNGPEPAWVTPSPVPPALRSAIEAHDMGRQISLERFMQDLHSGRFLGKYGVYVIDAAAVLMLVLVITGLRLWMTRR